MNYKIIQKYIENSYKNDITKIIVVTKSNETKNIKVYNSGFILSNVNFKPMLGESSSSILSICNII